MQSFLVIDGSSLVNRAFYALPPLTNRKGVQTGAIYGFLKMLDKLMDDIRPERIAVLFDPHGPTFRHALYHDYKGTRDKFPPELGVQIAILRKVLELRGIPIAERPGFEADDVAGSLVEAFSDRYEMVLVTGDRDYLQLVGPHARVLYTKRGITDTVSYTEETVEEEYGLRPDQLIDLKALMGDASDNIPGIAGIGRQTGLKLLKAYGDLDGVFAHADEVKGKALSEKLRSGQAMAELSRTLGTIRRDVPVGEDADYIPRPSDAEGLAEIYRELEFRAMGASAEPSAAPEAGEDAPPAREVAEGAWEEAVRALQGERIALKMFFAGDVHRSKPYAIGASDGVSSVFLFFPEHPAAAFRAAGDRPKVGFDTRGDLYVLDADARGLKRSPFSIDIALAAYLIDPTSPAEHMSDISRMMGEAGESVEAFLKAAKKTPLPEIDRKAWMDLLSRDLARMLRYAPMMEERLEREGMRGLLEDVEMPLSVVLANMERVGFAVDRVLLEEEGRSLEAACASLEARITELAGEAFNVQSPKQLGAILFDKLGLPVVKRTKTGYSTDQEVLETLAASHELPRLVLEYRQLQKLKSTYVDGILALLDDDGRLRSTFHQVKAATGRLSSSDPNLQNIPARTERGRELRKAFRAAKGCVLYDLDYSQIELRILAAVSGEESLIRGFEGDLDIHRKTAAEVFGKPYEEVSDLERSHAKAVNFGIVYGISDYGLSRNLGIPRKEAASYIDGYLQAFPGISRYMHDIVEQAKRDGYVETLLKRRRMIPELQSRNFNIRSFGERVALNTPIQGTAADIIKLAMVKVYGYLRANDLRTRMILTIHDELLFEVPVEELERVREPIRRMMTEVCDIGVTLKVSEDVGESWYDV